MKAYVLNKAGNADVLKISDIDSPSVGSNQVRVQIETIGLNYAEIQSRKGLYGWATQTTLYPRHGSVWKD